METLQAIAERKSVRKYREQQLADDVLDRILAAGCAAPVAMGRYQDLHLTIVQDKGILKRISDGIVQIMNRRDDPLFAVPTLVLVSHTEEVRVTGLDYANAACVIENMLLAATDLGIGSVFIWGSALAVEADADLKKAVGIPDGFKALASVALGYPESDKPRERELAITVSTNRV